MAGNPWQIYDALIAGVSAQVTVVDYQAAAHWAWVKTSEGAVGMAAVYPGEGRPVSYREPAGLFGMPLQEAAGLSRSWNFTEAGLGLAAVNAWYNTPGRGDCVGVDVADLGQHQPLRVLGDSEGDSFRVFRSRVAGSRVAVVGHFTGLEKMLSPVCDLSILERAPRPGDFPDSACEFLLPQADWVFITASALVNKTAPRLLELSARANVALVGPSCPMAPVLFDHGVDVLSGFIPTDPDGLRLSLRGVGGGRKFDHGVQVNRARG